MKNFNSYVLAAACLLLFSSCKKEAANTALTSSSQNTDLSAARALHWEGTFLSLNGIPPSRSIRDKFFIQDGHARIYSDDVNISKENYYSTRIRLMIPASLNIKGDSLNFEAGVKNPLNSSFYSPAYGRDIALYIKGETNEAFINNTATNDVDPDAQKRAGIKLGQTVRNNLPTLQYNFEEYGTLILQTFNRGVAAYRNDEYLSGLAYGNEPVIGRLREIGIIFKGSGFVDYIKVYSAVNGELLLSEDFNTNGQSTVMIYK